MAIVKIKWNKSASDTLGYVLGEREEGDPVGSLNCSPEKDAAINEFEAVRSLSATRTRNEAIHVIQSWSPEESRRLSRDTVNEMGMKLASDYFKGHQFLVVTHSHGEHLHNHIVVNPVSLETGRRIANKKAHLYNLRRVNDSICADRGLSVLPPDAIGRARGLPDRAGQIAKFKGGSYLLDLMQKIDFARAYSTSHESFGGILSELGVATRINDQSITFYYGEEKRGKRGARLGKVYDKPGLDATFAANQARAALFGLPSTGALIPLEELRRARGASIPDYCRRNGIALATNAKGERIISGCNSVVVGENQWVNARNRTRGSLLEFAASHRNQTYLRAVAEINGSPSLLELERKLGPVKHRFVSVHVPKPGAPTWVTGVDRVASFIGAFGADRATARSLFDDGRIAPQANGRIRIFAHGARESFIEYAEPLPSKWVRSGASKTHRPFHASRGEGRDLVVFTDPLAFIRRRGRDVASDRRRSDGILALLDPVAAPVDKYLAENPHVRRVRVVVPQGRGTPQADLDFFHILRGRYATRGVEVEQVSPERALSRGGPSLSL
jgi:hypothetical protein